MCSHFIGKRPELFRGGTGLSHNFLSKVVLLLLDAFAGLETDKALDMAPARKEPHRVFPLSIDVSTVWTAIPAVW